MAVIIKTKHIEKERMLTASNGTVITPSNTILDAASCWGSVETVQICLAHPGVDPSFEHNISLYHAVESGHLEVVKLLLADPRVNSNDRNGFIVATAIRERHVDVATCLVTHAHTDPTIDDQGAIFWAADYDLHAVVRVLLEDPRVEVNKDTIEHATGQSRKLLAAHDKWGVTSQRKLYEEYHSAIVQEYDAILAQALTMAWVAKQLPTWMDLVWPMSDRLKASFFI